VKPCHMLSTVFSEMQQLTCTTHKPVFSRLRSCRLLSLFLSGTPIALQMW
jgi:hypothetical protein